MELTHLVSSNRHPTTGKERNRKGKKRRRLGLCGLIDNWDFTLAFPFLFIYLLIIIIIIIIII